MARADVTGDRASVAGEHLADDAEWIRGNFLLDRETKVNAMIRGRRGAWVGIMNSIASVFPRVQQTLFKLPRDQFSRGILLKVRRAEVLNRRNLRLRKDEDPNVHQRFLFLLCSHLCAAASNIK